MKKITFLFIFISLFLTLSVFGQETTFNIRVIKS